MNSSVPKDPLINLEIRKQSLHQNQNDFKTLKHDGNRMNGEFENILILKTIADLQTSVRSVLGCFTQRVSDMQQKAAN